MFSLAKKISGSFIFFFFLFIGNAAQPLVHGTGLSFYFNQQVDNQFVQILLDHIESFSKKVTFLGKVTYPFPKLSRSSCKLLVWKDFEKKAVNFQNRIECSLDFEDYSRPKLVLDLSEEFVAPEGLSGDKAISPELSLSGPVTQLLRKYFYENKNKKYFLRFKDYTGLRYVALGAGMESSNPYLACSEPGSGGETKCTLMFNQLGYSFTKLSLGYTAKYLINAMCAGLGSSHLEGTCPLNLNDIQNEECFYDGMWVPHGVWGAISGDSSLKCNYDLRGVSYALEYPLGVVVVSPWGGRFSDPAVQVTGSGLAPLYKALKNFSLNNKKQKIIEYTLLPGRPPWSMEWISVQRFDSDKDLLSSVGCEERDVSTDTYYQTPVLEGADLSRKYSCTFHTYMQRIGK